MDPEELAQNFYNLFSKTVNGDNGEYIFQKQYNVAAGKGHMWDKLNVPFSYRGDGLGMWYVSGSGNGLRNLNISTVQKVN